MRARAIALLVVSSCLLWSTASASAATYTVTTTVDSSDGACTAALCSLRDAVSAANATPADDTIVLLAGDYGLTIPGNNETGNMTGDLDVADAATAGTLTINGANARTTIIDASALGNDRVISVLNGGNLSLSSVTITGGYLQGAGTGGGGIYSDGALALNNVAVTGNTATNSGGSFGAGGGVALDSGSTQTTITDSTFANNKSPGDGGAMYMDGAGPLDITNSTFTGNSVDTGLPGTFDFFGAYGGAMELDTGTVNITNSTIAGNNINGGATHPDGSGEAISGRATTVTLTNDIVANNTTTGAITGTQTNCDRGPLDSAGVNIDDDGSCVSGAPNIMANLQLGPLANNGGQTDTMAIGKSSPAFDAADTALAPPTDQRGLPRPGFTAADIGAYELQAVADLGVTETASPSAVKVGDEIVYTFTVTDAGPDPASAATLTDSLPGAVSFVAATTSQGSCTSGVSCALGSIASGGQVTVQVVVRAKAVGSASNTGSASSSSTDPALGNNSATVSATVSAATPSGGSAPKVVIGLARGITQHSTVINGKVSPDGATTTYYFQYGTTRQYGHNTRKLKISGTKTVPVKALVTKLRQGTPYHYRLVAGNAAGTGRSADRTFRTEGRRTPRLSVALHPGAGGHGSDDEFYRFVISGHLGAPRGVTMSSACRGTVAVTLIHAGRVVGRGRATVGRLCKYRTEITVQMTQVGETGTLTGKARFAGNGAIAPASAAVTRHYEPEVSSVCAGNLDACQPKIHVRFAGRRGNLRP
ncbi:MAG: choice-of-anchor Q domain-containing protein [Solirubrobacteraceae bacterium]